jgi:hypothetical protein
MCSLCLVRIKSRTYETEQICGNTQQCRRAVGPYNECSVLRNYLHSFSFFPYVLLLFLDEPVLCEICYRQLWKELLFYSVVVIAVSGVVFFKSVIAF